MIKINNFEIINNGSQLSIDVETNVGFEITNILLWDTETFKDESLSKSLNYKLEQINNKEIFIINASELGLTIFKDIYFIEVESNYVNEDDECTECSNLVLGITYNLLPYYNCLMNYVLENQNLNCTTCISNKDNNIIIMINLLIDNIEKGIDSGYYSQAIEMIETLKKLCSIKNCKNCKEEKSSTCRKFKQH